MTPPKDTVSTLSIPRPRCLVRDLLPIKHASASLVSASFPSSTLPQKMLLSPNTVPRQLPPHSPLWVQDVVSRETSAARSRRRGKEGSCHPDEYSPAGV